MAKPAVIEEIHQLYRVDPADFVAARAVLVKALRAAGRKDDARDVVKLRKPTVPAWALNQVAVEQPKLIARALDAGDALRTATEQTLAGDASGLPAATKAEATASAAVIDAARAHLPSLTADLRERMAATLRAAAVDHDLRGGLEAGLLTADHEPPAIGFGGTAETEATEAKSATPVKAKGKAAAAKLEEPPKPKRKIRRVGSPQGAAPKPVDEVDAKRRAKEVDRLKEEAAERKRQAEAERKRAAERKRQQAALDAAAKAARKRADQLERDAIRAEEAAAQTRSEADAATAEAVAAEQAATAGPPD